MADDHQVRILDVVERLPDWLRRDLGAKDDATRVAAEEALAAMIVNALTREVES